MGVLYLDHRDLTLSRAGERLRIDTPDAPPRHIPLALLEHLVIAADLLLPASLLAECGARGIAVSVIRPRHPRASAALLGTPHADARIRLAQYRLVCNPVARLQIARKVVEAKLANQARLLRQATLARPDRRLPLQHALDRLAPMEPSRATDLAGLIGIEGAGARAYFSGYITLFPEALGFQARRRRPPPDPVNALLSLGYTLLHARASHAAHGAGLDPALGFLHEPVHGRDSLACDLVEPLRPHIDAWVWQMLRERTLRADHFTTDGADCRLGKAGRGIFYRGIEPTLRGLARLLRREAMRLRHQLIHANGETP